MARWRRRLRRFLLGLLGLIAVLLALVLVALANLDARPMKGWIQRAARAQGVALDFDEGRVTLGGVRLRGLRIASPPADAARAPQLVTVGAVEGQWSLWSQRLDALVIRDVAITVVRNADGTTSLDRWLAGLPQKEEPPPEPLSALLGSLVPPGAEAHARVQNVTLTVLDDATAPPRTLTLTGLGLAADLKAGALTASLGPGPLRLTVDGAAPGAAERGARELVLGLRGQAKLDAQGQGALELGLTLERQTLVPALPPLRQVLALTAALQAHPAEHTTALQLTQLSLLDGAATMTAQLALREVPATATAAATLTPEIDDATLRLDLPAIARAVPAAQGPLVVEGEPLQVRVRKAQLLPAPRGELEITGKLTRLVWRELSGERLGLTLSAGPDARDADRLRAKLELPIGSLRAPGLQLTEAAISAEAEHQGLGALLTPSPAPGPGAPTASPLAGLFPLQVRGQLRAQQVVTLTDALSGLVASAEATLRSERELDADITAQLAELRHAQGGASSSVHGAQVIAHLPDLKLAANPLASSGAVQVQATVARVQEAGGVRASGLAMQAQATLAGRAPASVTASLEAAQLAVPGLAAKLGPSFGGGPVRVALQAPRVALDAAAPARSSGQATLSASYGGATVDGTVGGSARQVSWELTARAPRLGPAQRLAARSKGSFELASGALEQDSTFEVERLATPAAVVSGAHVHAISRGTTRVHDGTITIALDAVQSGGKALGKTALQLGAKVDLFRPALDLRLTGTAPPTDLHLAASVDASRALRWQAKGKLAGLAAAAAFLPPGPDWSRLTLEVDGEGQLAGVIAQVAGGVPVPAREPLLTARGHQRLAMTVRELHYLDTAQTRADISALTVKLDLDLASVRTAVVDVEIPRLDAVSSGVKLGAEALAMRLEAKLALRRGARTPLTLGNVDARLTVRARAARQTALPWYGVREPELVASVSGDPASTLALALRFANPGGGTAFEVAGDLERNEASEAALAEAPPEGQASNADAMLAGIVARRSLVLEGKLAQTLDGLDAAPETLKARGRISMPFRVESGDLTLFRTSAQLALTEVSLDLPKKDLHLAKINGELPVVQEFVFGLHGFTRVGQGEHGLFSQLRFPDYKPFSGGSDFLSVGELSFRGVKLGPMAGNARVDRDVIALDQMELVAMGGKITGQVLAELRGADTRLAFRGKATGVRPSVASATAAGGPEGDRLDANVAITVTPYRLGLEGRTEIVQIGKDHLLALLDVWDPYRADVAANRVRLGLKVGYPKQVRLHFSRGFASLAIELGGLAGLVRIDEINGIPIGPVMSHFLAPFLEPTP